MRPWSHVPRVLCLMLVAVLALAGGPAGGQTPKRGGILNAMLAEDPPGFLVHESSTISGVWPLSPCYSNLILFDPLKAASRRRRSSPSWRSAGRGRTTIATSSSS